MRPQKALIPIALLSLLLTACNSQTTPDASAPSSETPSNISSPTSEESSATPSNPPESSPVMTSDESPETASNPTSTESSDKANIPDEAANSSLTLDGFSDHSEDWKDGTFDIADKESITGMKTKLSSCIEPPRSNSLDRYGSGEQTLRLNLGHKYENLSFKTGLSNDSEALDKKVSIRFTDGTQQLGDIYTVGFDEIKDIEFTVKDQNVVFIQLYTTENKGGTCSTESVSPVIYDVNLD